MRILATLGFATVLAACAPKVQDGSALNAATGQGHFDVNDVSFLYPLPTSKAGVDALMPMPTISRADYEVIVPTAKDADIHPHGGTEPNPIRDPGVFKVVGVRVDPCAKDLPQATTCHAEVRLILQPVGDGLAPFTPGISTFDAAIHMIFEVPASERGDLIAGLQRLLALAAGRTSGKPLGLHPVIAAEGVGGPYEQELRSLVGRFAKEDRLRIATHVNDFESDRWFFFRAERKDGHMVQTTIPFTNATIQEFKTDGSTHEAKIVQNPSTGPDNVNDLIDSALPTSRFFSQSDAQKQAQIAAAIRIDNPLLHTPATLDCVSCHVATRSLNRVKPGLGDTGGDDPGRYVVPDGVTGTRVLDQDENIWSVRAFGYFASKVAITKGAINDSAKVAAALNAELGGAGPAGTIASTGSVTGTATGTATSTPPGSPPSTATSIPTATATATATSSGITGSAGNGPGGNVGDTFPLPASGSCGPGVWQVESTCIRCAPGVGVDPATRRCLGSVGPTGTPSAGGTSTDGSAKVWPLPASGSCGPGVWQVENTCIRCAADEHLDVAGKRCTRS